MLDERKHPETKRGRNPAKKEKGMGAGKEKPQNADTVSYAEDAAAKIGKSRDTVKRAVSRGNENPIPNRARRENQNRKMRI